MPSIFFASRITEANGCAVGVGGLAGCGLPGGTPEAGGGAATARGDEPAVAAMTDDAIESVNAETEAQPLKRASRPAPSASAKRPRRPVGSSMESLFGIPAARGRQARF